MAFINLLHNGYQGKLGETVGQKWKNQRTVRTYNPHNTSKSLGQVDVRNRYKRNIAIASECYPYFFGTQYVNPKNMNRFNAFTSAIDKIYRVRHEELVNTGIFKKHTGIQFKPIIYNTNIFSYVIYGNEANPLIDSITKLKTVAIFIQETSATINPPILDTFNTEAFYASFAFREGTPPGTAGAVLQMGHPIKNVKGSVVQFSFTINGKEHIQKPIIITEDSSQLIRLVPIFSNKKLIQKF